MLHVPLRKMEKKKTYMIIIKASIFPTNSRLKNVCMIKLPLCAMQWMLVAYGACLSMSYIIILIFKP
jgi:hypothetical protein